LSGNPDTCQNSRLASPAIDLTGLSGQTITLTFWHWKDFRSSNYSGGTFEVNAGSGWVKLTPAGGYDSGSINCSGGNSSCQPCALDGQSGGWTNEGTEGQWIQETVDLSSYAGSMLQLSFHFGNHQGYICCSDKPGWYVDDLRIDTSGSCTP